MAYRQTIYVHTEANRLTGKQRYLDQAVKAGDWWISLVIKNHPLVEFEKQKK
jgi:hypothetical protein